MDEAFRSASAEAEAICPQIVRGAAGLAPNSDPYRQSFDQAGVGMAVVDLDGRFLRVNRAFCELVEYSEPELLERNFGFLTHPEDLGSDLGHQQEMLAGRRNHYRTEKRYVSKSGHIIWVQLHASVVRDPGGQADYFIGQLQNITRRKQAEAALQESNAQRAAVLAGATQVSIIATDKRGVITVFNSGAERMLGYAAESMVGRATPEVFHCEAEVRERGVYLSRLFGRAITGFDVFVEYARQGGFEEREWTYVRRDGRRISVSLAVTALRDLDGNISGFLGIATDITARKLAESELRASEHRFRTLATEATFGVFETNASGECEYVNQCWSHMTGLTLDEARGWGWAKAIHEDDRQRVIDLWAQTACQQSNFALEYRYRTPNGKVTWVFGSAAPLRGADGEITGYLGNVVDITERKEHEEQLLLLNRKLQHIASVDALTGLLNRRTILECLAAMWTHAESPRVACIVLDVDHFKRINDAYGHAVGDEALRHVGRIMQAVVGERGLCGRIGGEEFLILCPNLDSGQAARIAEEVRRTIHAEAVYSLGHKLHISASCGVSHVEEGETPESLLAAADEQLYEAKHLGRNRVHVAASSCQELTSCEVT